MHKNLMVLLGALGLMVSCSSEPQVQSNETLKIEVLVNKSENLGPQIVTAGIPHRFQKMTLQDAVGAHVLNQVDRINPHAKQTTFLVDAPVGEKQIYIAKMDSNAIESASEIDIFFRSQDDVELEKWSSDQPMVKQNGLFFSNSWLSYFIALDRVQLMPMLLKKGDPPTLSAGMLADGDHNGLAALGLYNYDGIVPLAHYDHAEVELLAKGPLRAVVRIKLTGIQVRKEKLSVVVDYTFYAGKPYIDINFSVPQKTNLELKLAVGLPRHPEASHFTMGKKDNCHFLYTYGPQSRQGFFLGNAFFIRDTYVTDIFNEDELHHYLLIDPVDQGIEIRAMSLHSNDRLAISEETSFIEQARLTAAAYGSPPTVAVSN